MPRTFWYYSLGGCLLFVAAAFISAGRSSYEENILSSLFSSGSAISFLGIVAGFSLIFAVGYLCLQINGLALPDLIAVPAIALFVPLAFLASHFWKDAFSVFILILSLNVLLDVGARPKKIMLGLALLLAAAFLARPLSATFAVVSIYLLVKKKRLEGMVSLGLSLAFIFAIAAGQLHPSGTTRIHAALSAVVARSIQNYSIKGIIAVFTSSVEVQLLALYSPFLLISFVGLTLPGGAKEKSPVLASLLLSVVLALMIPALAREPIAARPLFMASSVLLITSASQGLTLLLSSVGGRAKKEWGILLGIAFILPAIISFF